MLRRVAAYGSWKAGWHLRQRRSSIDNDNSPWVVSNESSTVTALEEGFRVLHHHHHHHHRRVIMERSRRWIRTSLLPPTRPLLVIIVRLFLRLSQLHPKVSYRLLLGSLMHGVPCNPLGRRQQPQRQLRHHSLPRLLLSLYRLCRHPNQSSSYKIGSSKIM